MTQDQAIEEAKKIVASMPATTDNLHLNIVVPDKDSQDSSYWTITFKQEEFSEMDDRGFWMDLIRWEFESAQSQSDCERK
ncbi:hypothetical protein MUK70_10380 [Dyadobacter chenwenxiniae]|uniref:Uncharacterized protein n=1 Tax=Dyadobacter chenwenxiniae TaxID=2906456 RepID=A0A9X1PPC3_9BACT|nr:hypothetical protein [Dyadobacter chenwenxiniae]MCF0063228.1 hypothetical protein [Dyadobacter chenwenxiniae]UON85392.1 hypothetical protein MUK70_10380 [Dyadobacter chenwenxiniae]